MKQVIDRDGVVVAQFKNKQVEPKPGDESIILDYEDVFPGVDEWDDDYLKK